MAKLCRSGRRHWVAVTIVAALSQLHEAAAQPAIAPPSHVRATNGRLAAALREGLELSRTLRRLVAVLEDVKVLVYLHDGSCDSPVESCLMMGGAAGGYRFVHVKFRMTDGRQTRYLDHFTPLVAQIAHELQHAVEISRDTTVVDGATLAATYERIGRRYRSRDTIVFETDEALATGQAVLRELAGRVRRRTETGR
jgi:hypothetical protein